MFRAARQMIPTVAILLVLAAGAAARPEPPHGGREGAGGPPLGGPAVDDVNLPGRGRTFGEGMDMDRKPAGRLDARLVQRALESMRADAPRGLAIGEEQADEIKDIMDDYRAEMRAFRAEHAEELQRLRAAAGVNAQERGPGGAGGPPPPPPGGERAGPPAGGERRGEGMPPEGAPPRKGPRGDRGPRPEPTPEQQTARQQLRELMSKGPKAEALHARIWDVLRPEQRDLLNNRIEEMRREENARGNNAMGMGMEPGRPGRDEDRGPGGRDGARPDDDRGERVMERLQRRLDRLPPEERDRALQRIERWLDGEGDRERGGGERPRRERPPEGDRPPA